MRIEIDLNELALDTRRGIAKHTTTIKALQKLAKDPYRDIRLAVEENPKTSEDILSELAEDPDMDVRAAARSSLKRIL